MNKQTAKQAATKAEYKLSTKADSTLLDEVKDLVRKEKEIIIEVIEYLKEIEIRKLHLARGYSSMFVFATEFLGYSEAEAHIRIQAARLTQLLPEVTALIETGEMTLSVAATTQTHFRKENLRRKEKGQAALTIQEKREVLDLVSGSSRREAEQNLNIHFAQQSAKSLHFHASPELQEKIERLMGLMAHKNFERDLGKMVEILVDQELAKYEKRNSLSEKNMAMTHVEHLAQSSGVSYRSLYIPQKTRSLVWAKYKGKCTFTDPTTRRACESRHGIQIDHCHPFSKGGIGAVQNLTLLCANHNRWKADRHEVLSNL